MRSSRSVLIWLAPALLASVMLCWALKHDVYLRGSDAYYYALQADHWAATGEVKIPDSSLIHRAIGLMIRAGLSPETAVRVWIAGSLFALAAAVACLIGRARYRHPWWNGGIFLWILVSPSVLFTAIEFPKMFSAWVLLPVWLAPLVSAQPRRTLAILFAAATVLLHRMALPWAVLFGFALLVNGTNVRFSRKWLWPLAAFLLVAVAYLVFFRDRLHWLDWSRFSWERLQPGIYTLLTRTGLPLAIKVEVGAALAVFVFAGASFWRRPSGSRAVILIPLALMVPALVPLGSAEVFGVGERYALSLPLLCWLGTIFLVGQSHAQSLPMARGMRWVAAVAAVAVIAVSARYRLNAAHPLAIDPPFASYDRAVADLRNQEIPMLIAHKGLVFFYKFKLKREAFPYEPEKHWNQTRIWRVLDGVQAEELNFYSGERCAWATGLMRAIADTDYFLIREDCWQELRGKIYSEEDPDLYARVWETAINPSQPRPKFLYAKHKDDAADEFPAIAPIH